MSTSQKKQTRRSVRRALFAVVAAGLLGACPATENDSDGGAPDDGGTTMRDASTPRDGGADAGSDAGKADGGVDAAMPDASLTPPDAGPMDPSVPGADAPTLTKVGYFDDDLGPRILLEGRDPNGDIATFTVKFFQGDAPVAFDIDNDVDTPAVDTFTGIIVPTAGEAGFFVAFEPTVELVEAVDNIKVSVADADGRTSEELSATRMRAPIATTLCDPNGFNRCSGTAVCASRAGATVSYRCTALTTARNTACNSALALAPPSVTRVAGQVINPSLWDTPESCSSNDPKLKADRVVKLTLAAPASRVVLSTDNPNTDFDTALYLLESCTAQPAACVDANCPCSDDIPESAGMPRSSRSKLVLTNLAAGDHLIVVDSFPTDANRGSWFELSVEVE